MKILVCAMVLGALNLTACAALMQDMARNESAGYLGCPAQDIAISDQDAWGRSFVASCHGHTMACSITGDEKHRQTHCADFVSEP